MNSIGGFHYKGKDKRGVSQWRGSGNWQRALRVLGLGFTIYGVCAAIAFVLLSLALVVVSLPASLHTLILVSGIHALTFGGTGLWMRSLQKHIGSLNTPDQLAARFGVNEANLTQVAQDKGITPRISINNVDYYNPVDFAGDALTLLRGTTRPDDTQEVLLRPATDTYHASPELLLRVPDNDLASSRTTFQSGPTTPTTDVPVSSLRNGTISTDDVSHGTILRTNNRS